MASARPDITVVRCTSQEQIQQCYEIRYEVFSDEQGYSRELEVDEYDEGALHLLALEGTRPIGTVRVIYPPASDKFKLGRLAVRKMGRGKGVAQKLIAELEVEAKKLGAREMYAGSQVPVRGLYEKCGYHVGGEEYLDEGQPHIMMLKSLT